MNKRAVIMLTTSLFLNVALNLAIHAQTTADRKPGIAVYDIRDYGAVGDGETVNTAAIQKAIDDCTATSGGMVLIPGGNFVSGTLQLKDNVTLHVASAGRLLGSKNREDYLNQDVMIERGIGRGNGNIVLIFAAGAKNIAIEGNGTIDGQGHAFFTNVGDGTGPRLPGQVRDPNAPPPNVDRPHMMVFARCEDLRMNDIFLTQSAYHGVRILNCNEVNFDGVRIYNRINRNNDGFHFNGCRNVKVSNCEVLCQDDACALFGGNQFVTITNCTFSTRWSIFRFGGNSQNIAISNCLIYDTYGCAIKFGGGSRVENLSFSNIVMRNVTGPISLNYGGGGRRGGGGGDQGTSTTASYFRNISFNNIRASVVKQPLEHPDIPFELRIKEGEQNTCLTLNGHNNAFMENISLTDVHVTYAGGGTKEQAAKRDIPHIAQEYFGVWATAPFGPPSYGMYARNIRGLRMDNVTFSYEDAEARPAVVMDNVQDASIAHLSVEGSDTAESTIRLTNVKDVYFDAPRLTSASPVFVRVEGTENSNITIDGGDLTKAAKQSELAEGVNADVLKVKN